MIAAPLLIVGATAIGVIFGLGTVLAEADRDRFGIHDSSGGVFGIVLVVLGLLFARSAIHHSWLMTAVCASVGGFFVFALSSRSLRCSSTVIDEGPFLLAAMGIVSHRLFEGLTLGMSVISESSVGALGAAVITGHTTLETVGLGGYIASRDHLLAVVAVVAAQATFLSGALIAVHTSLAGPPWLDSAVSGVVGGVLLVLGVREIVTRFDV